MIGKWIRQNALGLVATFIALSGTAYAATAAKDSVTSKSIRDNAVRSIDVQNETLTADDIADSAKEELRSLAAGAVGATALSNEVRARRINVSMARGEGPITVMTLPDGTTLQADCYPNVDDMTSGRLSFDVAASSTFDSWVKTSGLGGDQEDLRVGIDLTLLDTEAVMFEIHDDGGSDFSTGMGTFVLTTGPRTYITTATAYVHGLADSCRFKGAVIPAT